jgi:hypothetical protein
MIDALIKSLVETSKKLSVLGQDEQAALQETAILFCGYKKVDGKAAMELSIADISAVPLIEKSSDEVRAFFSDDDLKIGFLKEKSQAVVLYYLEREEFFDTAPVFLQNYLAKGMFPLMICLLMERVDIDGLQGKGRMEYMVLPYFPVVDLSGKKPVPTIAFVGLENRLKVRDNQQIAVSDAMSNIHPYMPLIPALLMKEVES